MPQLGESTSKKSQGKKERDNSPVVSAYSEEGKLRTEERNKKSGFGSDTKWFLILMYLVLGGIIISLIAVAEHFNWFG